MRIFVVSDLHLGGLPHSDMPGAPLGSQICHSYGELAGFVDWVRGQATGPASVELVVNGDIVDFLMEDDYGGTNPASPWSPDEQLVIEKLKLIMERTRIGGAYGPFDAMRALLADGQSLTFLLGNHDVELSLPAVRHYLEQQLQGGGRFRFIYDGEAYVHGDLLIEHGNRYDPWNIVDHSALRQERSMLSRGFGKRMKERPSGAFIPPPGSFMVTRVINEIKRIYRFVDLLKPETEAVLPILLALHPNLQHVLAATLQFHAQHANKLLTAAEPARDGQLSAAGGTDEVSLAASIRRVLGGDANLFPVETGAAEQLGVADSWKNLKELSANIRRFLDDSYGVFANLTATARDEALRVAFAAWRGRLACDETQESAGYREAVRELAEAGGFNCVVFGHTHLRKRLTMAVEGRQVVYINTGTWTDTMHIPAELLEPGKAASAGFRSFVNDLKENRLTDYLERRLSYADITVRDGHVISADLHSYPLAAK